MEKSHEVFGKTLRYGLKLLKNIERKILKKISANFLKIKIDFFYQ
jgi:hypothetical protein